MSYLVLKLRELQRAGVLIWAYLIPHRILILLKFWTIFIKINKNLYLFFSSRDTTPMLLCTSCACSKFRFVDCACRKHILGRSVHQVCMVISSSSPLASLLQESQMIHEGIKHDVSVKGKRLNGSKDIFRIFPQLKR